MAHESPYVDAVEAARHLHFLNADGTPNVQAFYSWRYRHPWKLRAYRPGGTGRGGKLLFRRADLDLALEREGSRVESFLARARRKGAA